MIYRIRAYAGCKAVATQSNSRFLYTSNAVNHSVYTSNAVNHSVQQPCFEAADAK